MSKKFAFVFMIFALIFSGCAAKSIQNTSSGSAPAIEAPAAAPMEQSKADSYSNGPSFTGSGQSSDTNAPERLVIRNANLTIVVEKPGDAMTAINKMAVDMGGFVVTSTLYKTSTERGIEVPEANISVRVPAEKLNEALDQIKALVKDPTKDVTSETVTGQDVTKEYTDQRSRLKNLEDAEAQLREIMASATKTEDVLNVFQQLTAIREQIEVTKGQIQYYEESAAMSQIAVLIRAEAAVQPLEIGGWQPVGVARDAVQATLDGLRVIGNIAIWLVLFVLPIGAIIYGFVRLIIWLSRKMGIGPRRPKGPKNVEVSTITTPPSGL
jgi:hypothetical protein